ncbi:caveolae-associated protein 4a-like [Pseudochaenichthys georgianus]|uniref:caveolae-associated protein 4a-like n=1 Tax=Pseudochaenichthys georgianus TaxID=52239 RepID=UPI00146AC1AD|nr:caveolae-associated protein 4a-like [Pseudochaenichthys georgianus]
MTDKSVPSGGDDASNIMALLERVAGLMDSVQTTQKRMEERQLDLESTVKNIQTDVVKLSGDHANTSSTVNRLLEKTRKVSRHVKDVRVRVENQNVRVKKVEATQGDLLAKNKFKVVIYQGEQEVKTVAPGIEPAEPSGSAPRAADVEPDKFDFPPESDEEDMVVEEETAESSAAKMKKSGLTRIESFKANMSKTRENLGSKVNKLGERIVTAERRQKIRQSGERLKETISKSVPAKLKKERTVAEGQEGAMEAANEETTEATNQKAAPVLPPKGRKGKAVKENEEEAEEEVPMYDMKQLS